MTNHATGAALAERLYAAEAAIDLALSETAQLAAMLPTARAQAYLSAVTGQRAFDGAAAAIGALTSARSSIVDTHNVLASLARRLGLETLAAGGLDKPEDRPPVGGEGARGQRINMVNERLPPA
ncbi:hypothetical protein BZG35_07730 [Brevundimonas sp. LM2]|uniref:hypothetical protein n=1 Tax=Brevundimonas sp. LM2 TaxID=1938605 RepID=UPI0009839885|nr:hypothetical protein [Brevundimonas sp. LM2]AQR61555.1 hypothetical protein BZG35_07730 [Brevundimonas sp. LM2]